MIAESRPLRFVMVIVGGWIGVRVAILWPADSPIAAVVATTPHRIREARAARLHPAEATAPPLDRRIAAFRSIGAHRSPPVRGQSEPVLAVALAAPTPIEAIADTDSPDAPAPNRAIGAPLAPARETATASRLSGSAWLIARGAGPAATFSPQLGGSQTGARLTYALGEARRIAIAARISSALAMRQREGAIGLDWQPTKLPVHLFAEQRIAIAGTRGGPSVGVIAGLPPTPLSAGFALDGYGQAGAIGRGGGEAFADGAARLMHRVATIGKARVELGVGAWGGAQRGASRVDIGPAASVAVPTVVPLRVSLEWRQRVAGDARPASGLALSIGTDF